MRNSENLTANNSFSKPTRYQVTTPFPGMGSSRHYPDMDLVTGLCQLPQNTASFLPSFNKYALSDDDMPGTAPPTGDGDRFLAGEAWRQVTSKHTSKSITSN